MSKNNILFKLSLKEVLEEFNKTESNEISSSWIKIKVPHRSVLSRISYLDTLLISISDENNTIAIFSENFTEEGSVSYSLHTEPFQIIVDGNIMNVKINRFIPFAELYIIYILKSKELIKPIFNVDNIVEKLSQDEWNLLIDKFDKSQNQENIINRFNQLYGM
jgi:hypothetical protein